MEFREGLESLYTMCHSYRECNDCPLNVDPYEKGEFCDLLCNGFDVDLICKAAEEAKKQAEKPMTLEDAQLYVMNHLDARTKLEQLAEEAAELSQAALKLIRAKGLSNNVTPIDEKEALANVREEIIDVLACIKVYDYELNGNDVVEAMENSPKWLRWAERLKGEMKEMTDEQKELYEVAKPLVEYIRKKYTPMTTAIVTGAGVEVLNTEVNVAFDNDDYWD